MHVLYDIRYHDQLCIDVYQPTEACGGVLLLHSGWLDSDKSAVAHLASRIAENGFVVFAADYRLPPHVPFASSRFDALAAINWIQQAEFEFDVNKLAVWGVAVGGTIATEVALSAGLPCVSWSAPIDLKGFIEQTNVQADRDFDRDFGCVRLADLSTIGPDDGLLRQLIFGLVSNNVSWLEASTPLSRVGASSGPMLFVNSLRELVPASGVFEMQRALTQVGVCSMSCILPGERHGPAYSDNALPASLEFLRRAVGLAAKESSEI